MNIFILVVVFIAHRTLWRYFCQLCTYVHMHLRSMLLLANFVIFGQIFDQLLSNNNTVNTNLDCNSLPPMFKSVCKHSAHYLSSFLKSNNSSQKLLHRTTSNFINGDTGPITTTKIKMVRYLGQQEAIKIDEELFNEYKFSVDQLMELAGLSVASTIATVYGANKKNDKVLVICGPGNNGGDGIVAARHLRMFGFTDITILHARKPTKDLFIHLTRQAELNDVNISYDPTPFLNDKSIGLIVDALFGFSFKPPVRPDFEPLMSILTQSQSPIVSVDIPSGWDVEKGPSDNKSSYFMPDTLVSLTAPKLCAKYFTGSHHYLGGRFVPKILEKKYSLNLPEYPGLECITRLENVHAL